MKKLSFLLLLIIFLACEKETVDPHDQVSILNEWELISTFNPWTQETTILADIDRLEVYDFRDNDSLYIYVNNDLDKVMPYILNEVIDADTVRTLQMGENGPFDAITLTHNTLVIDQTPYDGFRFNFIKRD